MNLGRKLTSLKFQVQLPIYNVHAIMHGTGTDDKSIKGESISVSLFSERLIQWNSLLCLWSFVARLFFFVFLYFVCLFTFFFFGMGSIITKTDVYSMTHTSPLMLSPTFNSILDLKPSHSFIRIWLLHSHIFAIVTWVFFWCNKISCYFFFNLRFLRT